MTTETSVVPFGKYKGQPIEVLLSNPGYRGWLLTLRHTLGKYPDFHEALTITEPTETPESA
jgi:hypothetical protein